MARRLFIAILPCDNEYDDILKHTIWFWNETKKRQNRTVASYIVTNPPRLRSDASRIMGTSRRHGRPRTTHDRRPLKAPVRQAEGLPDRGFRAQVHIHVSIKQTHHRPRGSLAIPDVVD
ncbi:MAG: hypothetical protein MI923_11280 [Phycisphaerales bacterium]|nr:hypothetical protein [Phycisphaerales bacterium]